MTMNLINKRTRIQDSSCKFCTKSAATFCATEQLYHCKDHDKEHPSSSKHLRVKLLSQSLPCKRNDICDKHESLFLFFCVDCNKGLCNNCFIHQAQTNNEHLGHRIIESKQEFNRVSDIVLERDIRLDQ
jgi:hypothetical protein